MLSGLRFRETRASAKRSNRNKSASAFSCRILANWLTRDVIAIWAR